uniref:Uncharacterized protein n=1 Tax=Fagus sylvatica TaxID=28930 RepID=A0A2N9GDA1_FAGSY
MAKVFVLSLPCAAGTVNNLGSGSLSLSPSRLLSSLFLSVFHFSISFSHSALNGEFGMV